MKRMINFALVGLFLLGSVFSLPAQDKLKVVATLSVYADIAKYVGGDKVEVKYIVRGDQDPHFIKPRPSYAALLASADLFIDTGLDLELWAPSLVDKSGNPRIRSGQPGYVAAAAGVKMLDVPSAADRSQGDVHIYGNPHIHTSPLNAKIIAENIAIGLSRISPENRDYFQQRLDSFKQEIDRRLFGQALIDMLGSDLLSELAASGQLIDFLKENEFQGRPLIDLLGGWMKDMLPLYGQKLVAYHKNWIYFTTLFGLKIEGYVEPKVGIPPSARHVDELIRLMERENIKVILAANYFDERKVREIADRVGATPVIVPMGVMEGTEADNYFHLIDLWIRELRKAFHVEA
ncbi:MAG: zinc ABC transporter substrate-binding protein [Calditrichaeota bacterium]|nr:MAG: zinc ABC transporter substrate-binding protein [Calditrichota bacterium]